MPPENTTAAVPGSRWASRQLAVRAQTGSGKRSLRPSVRVAWGRVTAHAEVWGQEPHHPPGRLPQSSQPVLRPCCRLLALAGSAGQLGLLASESGFLLGPAQDRAGKVTLDQDFTSLNLSFLSVRWGQ